MYNLTTKISTKREKNNNFETTKISYQTYLVFKINHTDFKLKSFLLEFEKKDINRIENEKKLFELIESKENEIKSNFVFNYGKEPAHSKNEKLTNDGVKYLNALGHKLNSLIKNKENNALKAVTKNEYFYLSEFLSSKTISIIKKLDEQAKAEKKIKK